MTERTIKKISELNEWEWVVYNWTNVTTYGDEETVFVRGFERGPDEAIAACENWKKWADEWRTNKKWQEHNAQPPKVG